MMNKFRIMERDGEYKVQKLREQLYLGVECVREKVGRTWMGQPVYETKEKTIYGDPTWIDWFAWNKLGQVRCEQPDVLCEFSLQFSGAPVFFEDKEAAVSYIEHFYGQQYTLEEADWRTV